MGVTEFIYTIQDSKNSPKRETGSGDMKLGKSRKKMPGKKESQSQFIDDQCNKSVFRLGSLARMARAILVFALFSFIPGCFFMHLATELH